MCNWWLWLDSKLDSQVCICFWWLLVASKEMLLPDQFEYQQDPWLSEKSCGCVLYLFRVKGMQERAAATMCPCLMIDIDNAWLHFMNICPKRLISWQFEFLKFVVDIQLLLFIQSLKKQICLGNIHSRMVASSANSRDERQSADDNDSRVVSPTSNREDFQIYVQRFMDL